MTRKPTTKSEMPAESDDTPDFELFNPGIGRRFVGDDVLAIERELIADGRDLPNRGIPVEYRERVESCSNADELRQLIKTETAKEHPNQSLIGYINDRIAQLTT
jgi:hypothetical protein